MTERCRERCAVEGCATTHPCDNALPCHRHSTTFVALPDRPYYVLPGGLQVKDVVAHLPYNAGTAAAYIFRAGRKPGNEMKVDLQKAIDHLRFEIERIEKGESK